MTVYDFSAKLLNGEDVLLSRWQGQVLLIVNTASQCGFTPQYAGLEDLYEQFGDDGLTVLGFPCNQFGGQEPGGSAEIAEFCARNYRVTFPLFDKIEVNGPEAHPLFQYLKKEQAGLLAQRGALAATQKDLEAQIATINERSSVIETRMYAARGSSTRDLQAMDEEVRHLKQRRRELEDEELAAMVEQEPIDAALAVLASRLVPLGEKAEVLGGEVALAQAEIDAEVATATATRAEEAARLPEALATRYEALRTRLKGAGAARLIGNRCDGCHLELSSAEVERIRAAAPESVVTCDQCGRILVPT